MSANQRETQRYSRRDFGKIALAGLPVSLAMRGTWDAPINGVQIGAITYSFRSIPDPVEIIKAMAQIGLTEVELMSNHAEALAGAPSQGRGGPGAGRAAAPPAAVPAAAPAQTPPGQAGGRGRANLTPEQQAELARRQEELKQWRASVSMDKFAAVRKQFNDAGIEVRLLCYNMSRTIEDAEIDYAFQMAKALGVKAMSSTTQVSVSKRVAPFADKHQVMVGFHGHSNLTDPDEFAKPESFATAMSYSKYFGVNLDIGHFTAANYDPIPYIQEHHDRITNLHLKDRKKDQGANVPWGQGDTPIKQVLQLLREKKYDIPANIEYEYQGADTVAEIAKCYQFCKDALA
jgi:sugar phosphate isomerase/epimerase